MTKSKQTGKGSQKSFKARRTMNPPHAPGGTKGGAGSNKTFQQHDAANRMGDYEGTGTHARTGNRGHQ